MLTEGLPLSIRDRYEFLHAPVRMKNGSSDAVALQRFASARARGEQVTINNIVKLPKNPITYVHKLHHLEATHSVIILYLWLRFVIFFLVIL